MRKQNKYSALYYLTRSLSARKLTQAAQEALQVKTAIDPDQNKLVVTFWNRDTQSASLEIRLEGSETEKSLLLKPDEEKSIEFPLNENVMKVSARKKLNFKLKVVVNGVNKTYAYTFRPAVAKKNDLIKVDGDLMDWSDACWQKLGTCDFTLTFKDRRLTYSDKLFEAEYAFAWNEKGLWLALKVCDKDFIPAKSGKDIWQHDSLEIMIDQANDAKDGVTLMDKNDCVFFLCQNAGKDELLLVEPANGQKKGMSKYCQAVVKRDGDKTIYEGFIPAKVLNQIDFQAANNIGFALKLHNREKVGDDKSTWSIQVSSPEYPYHRPDRWNDLLLKRNN